MTLPFIEEVINDGIINIKNFRYPHFVGFLNPSGVPIKFRDKFGYTGHGDVSIQEEFRAYYILKIRDSKWISPLEEYIMSEEYQKSEKERYSKILNKLSISLKEHVEYRQNEFPSVNDQMAIDIYSFLLNCYSADTFFEGVGKIDECMSELEFWNQEYKNKKWYDVGEWDFKIEYRMYQDRILVDIFKNVMIQNLGYHSVERVPRTITTSSFRIYETFYNYLLNDFTIFQIPKMIFDSKEKKYVQQNPNDFFLPDNELRLKEEIQAIKKLVPLKERAKYYR